ncbi:MAG: BatD family protein [Prevotellaceae bacterium]|jgi:hypothetical protein|nr:BatD family protein [Prevotellaceae bacterium]
MKRFLIVLFTFFQVVSIYSQSVTVQAPKVVAVGEQFSIKFEISAKFSQFTPPDLSNFNVMAGPVQGNSMLSINGKVSTTYYVSYYVSAKSEGKITIGKADAIIDGKTVSSNSHTIDVVKADAAINQQHNQPQQGQTTTATVDPKDLYARVELSRTSLYRGESLVAALKIYTRVGITGASNFKLPTFTGFFSQEMDVPQNEASFHRENVGGIIYNVAVLRRYVLTPQQLGTLIIPPLEMTLSVQIAKPRQSRNMFDDFFDSPYQEIERKIQSPSVSVNVNDLPLGAPTFFKGAVGNFKIEANIDKTHTQANQAIAYSLNISGTGNLKLVEQPKINFPPDFDKYEPKITENIKTTTAGNTGNKKYEYALIPRSAGDFVIPGVEFTYFDPSKGKYTTLKSNDLTIHVERDPTGGGTATTTVPGINQQNIRHLGQDIVFIKTTPLKVSAKGNMFFASLPYWLLFVLLLVIFIVLSIAFKKRIKDSRNLALMRNKTANKIAHKRLKSSLKLLKEGNTQGFYEELLRAMWGYVSDKFNIPVADLSRENAKETLLARNAQQADTEMFLSVVDECEFARYAPSAGRNEMEYVYDNAMSVISKFEQTIR